MDRRTLLQRILQLASAATVAPLLARPALATAAVANPTVLLQHSPLAGFQYYAGEALWPQLKLDALLTLIREPGNRYDPRAVRIDYAGHKLGYLPRVDNAAVSQLLDRRQRLEARIAALRMDTDPWERIQVAVGLRL